MAGNFHETCELESIRIEDGRFLRCLVRREDGELSEGEMDLNCCIGNENGEDTQRNTNALDYRFLPMLTDQQQVNSSGEGRVCTKSHNELK